MTIERGKKEVTSSSSTLHEQRIHEESVSKSRYVEEAQRSIETEKRERVLMDAQGNVLQVSAETSQKHPKPDLASLDFLAAELMDSANSLTTSTSETSNVVATTTTASQEVVQTGAPAVVQKNVIYERVEQELPVPKAGGTLKVDKSKVCEEELVSSSTSVDYAAKYYIERSETWEPVTTTTTTNDGTTKTTVVRSSTTDGTLNEGTAVDVRDVSTEMLKENRQQQMQESYVEYESKTEKFVSDTILEEGSNASYQPVTPQTHRRRTNVDIRDVSEDISINEVDYCTSSSYTVQHAASGHDLASSRRSNTRETSGWDGTYVTEKETVKSDETSRYPSATEKLEIELESKCHSATPDRSKTGYTTSSTTGWDGTFVNERRTEEKMMQHDVENITGMISPEGRSRYPTAKMTTTTVEVEILEPTRRSATPERRHYTTSSTSGWDGTFVNEKVDRRTEETVRQDVRDTGRSVTHDKSRYPSATSTTTTERIEVDVTEPKYRSTTPERHYMTSSTSTWDGTFINEKVDSNVTKMEETVVTHEVTDSRRPSSPDKPRHSTDKPGKIQPDSSAPKYRSITPEKHHYTTSSTSSWDGTFITEKVDTSVKKTDETVVKHEIIDTRRSISPDKPRYSTDKSEKPLYPTDKSDEPRYSINKPDKPVKPETPDRKSTTPEKRHHPTSSTSAWDGTFVTEKSAKLMTTARDGSFVFERQPVETQKPTASPRPKPTPTSTTSTTVDTQSTKLNASTWDGSFVPEAPTTLRSSSTDMRHESFVFEESTSRESISKETIVSTRAKPKPVRRIFGGEKRGL